MAEEGGGGGVGGIKYLRTGKVKAFTDNFYQTIVISNIVRSSDFIKYQNLLMRYGKALGDRGLFLS